MGKDTPPLQIRPYPEELVNVDLSRGITSFQVTVQNPTKNSYMYKMKLSNFDLFHANPYQGILEGNQTLQITIILKKSAKELNFMDPKAVNTRLLFEYGPYKPKMGDFATAWKAAHNQDPTSPPPTPTAFGVPNPEGFYFHKFMAKVSPPANVPANYAQFMEQKVVVQDSKLEKISWLLAEKNTENLQLKDELKFYRDLVQTMRDDFRKVHYIFETCNTCHDVIQQIPQHLNYSDPVIFDYHRSKARENESKQQQQQQQQQHDDPNSMTLSFEQSYSSQPPQPSRKSISTYSDQQDNRLRYGDATNQSTGGDDNSLLSPSKSSLLVPFTRRERKPGAHRDKETTTVTTTITTTTTTRKEPAQ